MDMIIFENDKAYVLDAFRKGAFDYVEVVSEVIERKFFQFAFGEKIMHKLAGSYPTPREKEEVPVWLYLASDIALRLHGGHGFAAYPWVIRTGGLLNALGPDLARKRLDPVSGDMIVECKGFNRKNHYPRQAPCHHDYLRKLARDTRVEELERWYNQEVAKCLLELGAFAEEGIFIGDASYIFVPDNPNYEGSEVLLFDEHNHPVAREEELSPQQRLRCQYRRCYKLIDLVHTNRQGDFYFYVGLRVVNARAHECPILYGMVENFVEAVGQGVMKDLIVDRGFVSGEDISRCKKKLGVEVIVPLRKNMAIYEDAWGLSKLPGIQWQEYERKKDPEVVRVKPEAIRKREATRQRTLARKKAKEKNRGKKQGKEKPEKTLVAGMKDFTSWESCSVPMNVVLNRDLYRDGHEESWVLVTTKDFADPREITKLYAKRPVVEERHRQIKLFWDLAKFPSPAFSLVVNQIVFVGLAYTLLQLYLLRLGKAELNQITRRRLRQRLLPAGEHITLYYNQRFAFLDVWEHQELLLTLEEKAKKKILRKTRRLRKEFLWSLGEPRAP